MKIKLLLEDMSFVNVNELDNFGESLVEIYKWSYYSNR